jgi:predicted flavoprotein YhiN
MRIAVLGGGTAGFIAAALWSTGTETVTITDNQLVSR